MMIDRKRILGILSDGAGLMVFALFMFTYVVAVKELIVVLHLLH
jgi:hypothetical protein